MMGFRDNQNKVYKNLANGINSDGSLNTKLVNVPSYTRARTVVISPVSRTAPAGATSTKIDLNALRAEIGTGLMQLLLTVTVATAANTTVTLKAYNTDAGGTNDVLINTVTNTIDHASTGVASVAVDLANQACDKLEVILANAGAAAYTAGVTLCYLVADVREI